MHDSTKPYRGRFAPSPTGPLHFGSLIAAVGSYLDARRNAGRWLVRMEDLDRARESKGAADAILRTLEAYGFQWDDEVVRQSNRGAAYGAALDRLRSEGAVFPCACTRREISDSNLGGTDEPIYPGTCRNGLPPGRPTRSIRARVDDAPIAFEDRLQGRTEQNLAREVGDFVVRRADGLFAYQLAVVVDDFEQGISDVVRGADLLASTPRQILLQRRLGYPTPRYAHLPVAVNAKGEKLSKQTLAAPLAPNDASSQLCKALRFLGQDPPRGLDSASISDLWGWAIGAWTIEKVPKRRSALADVCAF
ncbi:MAG TPA: tRNA glutamyl-Q(34) synthetase GluQRS [Burkholderiales bacterium]|nr:tRNA glutamyl-Q(34) synthetase GluQRS [Burkholderiales bacterium]